MFILPAGLLLVPFRVFVSFIRENIGESMPRNTDETYRVTIAETCRTFYKHKRKFVKKYSDDMKMLYKFLSTRYLYLTFDAKDIC